MASGDKKAYPKNSVRRSQILTMYGPGALVDLPDRAVLVAGLEFWRGTRDAEQLREPRLVQLIRRVTGQVGSLQLRVPPTPKSEDDPKGIAAWHFPEWSVSQDPDPEEAKQKRRARRMYHRRHLKDLDRKTRSRLVPVRFVAACRNGHIQDIDWVGLVHAGAPCVSGAPLWFDELGVSGDLADFRVRCGKCELSRSLGELAGEVNPLGPCRGKMPWLGPSREEPCVSEDGQQGHLRLLIRHASNAYFPVSLRVISLPETAAQDGIDVLAKKVREQPEMTRQMLAGWTREILKSTRPHMKDTILKDFAGASDDALFDAIQRSKSADLTDAAPTAGSGDPLRDELETFWTVPETEELTPGDELFTAHAYPMDRLEDAHAEVLGHEVAVRDFLDKVVLVERLREVQALAGFTRLEPPIELIASEYDIKPRMAPITYTESWRPAIENRGEGVFIALSTDRVEAWLASPAVSAHVATLRNQLLASRYGRDRQSQLTPEHVRDIELPYILLHTLSHLLLTAVALECGYSAASIRERIYLGEVDGRRRFGLLLYTGTADSEGTLGGLVEVGKKITRHLASAIEIGTLCSNDPVCAHGQGALVGEFVHGAACHGCVLIAESSCERRNEFLDRSLVLPTVGGSALAFFK